VYPAWMDPHDHLLTLEHVEKGMREHLMKIQDPKLLEKWNTEINRNIKAQSRIRDYINTHRYQEIKYDV